MASFEERFAAAGRALDAFFERFRRAPSARRYRSVPRRRTPARERLRLAAVALGDRLVEARNDYRAWRSGLNTAATRRVNAALILAAMAATAGATWFIVRATTPAISGAEARALATLKEQASTPSPAAPGPGPWWNRVAPPPR